MKIKFLLPLFFSFIAGFLFTGCPVSIVLTGNDTELITYRFETTAGSSIHELISSFDSSADKNDTRPSTVFDTIEIERALFQKGLTSVHAITTRLPDNQEKLEASFKCTTDKFNFIKLYHNQNNELIKAEITFSPAILQELITEQDSIIQKYADLLMAPCFTDEVLTKEEYIELVASLYGESIAKDFTSGNITIAIKNARTKKYSPGITIPLIDILTLTEEKTFTVTF